MSKSSQQYYWTGIDLQGSRVKGILHATDELTLLEVLKKQKITPIKIKKKISHLSKSKNIKPQQITDFTSQLANLINTGIPLVTALDILKESNQNANLQYLIIHLHQLIEDGNSLSSALQQYPQYFSTLYTQLVYVGEQSGSLVIMLEQIVKHQETIHELSRKINKALLYPLTVISIAIIITSILLIFVIPQFTKLFADFGAQLPFYTRWVLTLTSKIKYIFGFIVLLSLIISFLHHYSKKNLKLLYYRDRTLLSLPWYRHILQHTIMARFTQTLAVTLEATLPLTDALQIIASICNNVIYTQALLHVREQILTGENLHAAMKNTNLFPKRLLQIIAVAEESGTLKIALSKSAVFYEQQVDNNINKLTQLLEPAIMIILGLIIGGLITAIYLPIFKLGNVI